MALFFVLNKRMTKAQRIHGSTGVVYNEKQSQVFEIYTLIDISATGIIAPYNPRLKQIIDDNDTIIYNEKTWNKSRNKQRNWETLTQVIGLRAVPFLLSTPRSFVDDVEHYNFGNKYKGKQNIWTFSFSTEQLYLFSDGFSDTAALIEDLNQVPITVDLDETVPINPAIIDSKSSSYKNISVKIIHTNSS